MLANELRLHRGELSADFQQYYGMNLDAAMRGGDSPRRVAALLLQLPQESRTWRAEDRDAAWTPDRMLTATLVNQMAALMYGLSDPRKRGSRPEPIGPEAFRRARMRSLPALVLPIDKLMEELKKPRRARR